MENPSKSLQSAFDDYSTPPTISLMSDQPADKARHVRIDEGLKRGPRKPKSNAVAVLQKDKIIQHMASGGLLSQISATLGVSPAAISQVLANDPKYIEARLNGVHVRLDTQYQRMEEADDALNLARARECWKAATWFAEREFPERWGQKQQIEHKGAILQINPELLKSANELLDAVRTRQEIDVTPQLPEKKE